HSPDEARQLDPAHVDYAVAGPVFATPSKPGYGPSLGHTGLREITEASAVPVLAIGGISRATAPEVLRAGAAGLAVMGGVMRATDPAAEVQELLSVLDTSPAKAFQPRPR